LMIEQNGLIILLLEELKALGVRQEHHFLRSYSENAVASRSTSRLQAPRMSKRPSSELDEDLNVEQPAPSKKVKKAPAYKGKGKRKAKDTDKEEDDDGNAGADESGDDL
jgi:hypothetical protein